MKPKPFSELNHFTVPVATDASWIVMGLTHRRYGGVLPIPGAIMLIPPVTTVVCGLPPGWRGRAIARYVLDHPAAVAGRRVLDLAAGSGLVAIAAGKAGAAAVTANDIDPYAMAAITLNARANAVTVTQSHTDLLDGDGGDADTVLAGDAFYTGPLTRRVQAFLERAAARGARVLVGDPARGHLPTDRWQTVTSYQIPPADAYADAQLTRTNVLRPVQ